MRRHEMLDTIGLGTVFMLATVEAITHFGFRHDHGLCLGIPLMIASALLLLAVHWPAPRVATTRKAEPLRTPDPLAGAAPNRMI